MKIHWHGFLKHAVKEYPSEACGFLFSKLPYHPEEEWHVFKVRNIAQDPINAWDPDKREMARVKALAIKAGLVKIGNVHTHPIEPGDNIDLHLQPSEKDLKFARQFNDVIRGILAVGEDAIYGIVFHDKFGNLIRLHVESQEGGDSIERKAVNA